MNTIAQKIVTNTSNYVNGILQLNRLAKAAEKETTATGTRYRQTFKFTDNSTLIIDLHRETYLIW
ncbi:hypothetical protein [Caudoviricetes sp.]|nr:hypothetical protein [Caudoviricetes sp.]